MSVVGPRPLLVKYLPLYNEHQARRHIGLDNAVYLATEAAGMQFGEGNLIMLQGEAKAGKVYDEFYVDDAKLYELILNTFYTEVALK